MSVTIINQIINSCKKIGANAPIMLAFAKIESNFKIDVCSKSKTYCGLYQLSNGYGGCIGDERTKVDSSVRCTWRKMQENKLTWLKNQTFNWEDWFYYGMHQQGYSGFVYLLSNSNKKITDIEPARYNAIINNLPKVELNKIIYVSDFLKYWKNRFEKEVKFYNYVSPALTPIGSSILLAVVAVVGLWIYKRT